MMLQVAPPRIHIFLPVHNRRVVTEAFLQCLNRQSYSNWHLILIDDGSSDGTGEMASQLVPGLTLLRGHGNWWWAGSLEQGVRWVRESGVSSDDLVLMINDDTEIGPDFLSNAIRAMRPQSLLLAQAYRSNGEFCEAGVSWDWANLTCVGVRDAKAINCFSTRGLFLSVGDLLKIGGFYPRLLPHYLSDYEFTIRAYRKGYDLISCPDLHLRYFEALTGIRNTDDYSVWKALKINLSIKSASNPLYWSSFVLLASPRRYMPRNLARVWWRYLQPLRARMVQILEPVRRLLAPVRRFAGRVKRKLLREWTGRMSSVMPPGGKGNEKR